MPPGQDQLCTHALHVHGHVSGFSAPGLPRVCGGPAAPSPTRGSPRQPDRPAIVPPVQALQDPSGLVLDTHPTQPNPPPPALTLDTLSIKAGHVKDKAVPR